MVLCEQDPAELPRKDKGVDLVFECTGIFTHKKDLEKHLQTGAKKVILWLFNLPRMKIFGIVSDRFLPVSAPC